MKKIFTYLCLICLFTTTATIAVAQLSVPGVLSSDMVLQQGKQVPIWGKANPNGKVEVSFGSQRVTTKADANGMWKVELSPLSASKTPAKMSIKSGKEIITFDNILVGEVWLCSGQSNMQYSMKRGNMLPPAKGEDVAELELKKPANDGIRVFYVSRDRKAVNSWKIADGKSLEQISALGYFFVKELQEKLDVPVGIISSAIGGTRIEPWTSREAYSESPYFASQYKENNGMIDEAEPEVLYEYMIAPLVPFALRGFLWYQGESNCSQRDRQYAQKYEVMVESWRKAFNAPQAPFYSVLLAPHVYSDRFHKQSTVTAEELPLFWEQQINTTNIAKTDMICISDLVDDLRDIHPSYKWSVGQRMAGMALAKDYGVEGKLWSGPRLKTETVVADSVELTFEYCGESLKAGDNKRLRWFEITGSDGIFRPALAELRGRDKIVVYHPDIKNPIKVRLGWHETAIPNLVNSDNLPVFPFR